MVIPRMAESMTSTATGIMRITMAKVVRIMGLTNGRSFPTAENPMPSAADPNANGRNAVMVEKPFLAMAKLSLFAMNVHRMAEAREIMELYIRLLVPIAPIELKISGMANANEPSAKNSLQTKTPMGKTNTATEASR